ncbi:hypothetical protein Tco_0697577 [Tanacetum coccineum]
MTRSRPDHDPPVDWRSTTVDRWLTGGPSVVDRWWQVRGTVHPRWQYEVAENIKWQYKVATDGQSEHDTCHSACVSPRHKKSKAELKGPYKFDNHQPQEIPEVTPFVESKEWIETNNELYTIMEDFMKRMNQQREQEALLVAQREQELREQEQAAQEKEELSPNSVFRQLIEETCGMNVCEEQKQNMEDTMLDLLEICRQKELYCMHNNVEDLIESALNSKLLLINLNSQRLNKEEQEVKNTYADPQLKLKSDSLIMGNEELSTIPEKELDEFIKSSVEDLIPIPRESKDSFGSEKCPHLFPIDEDECFDPGGVIDEIDAFPRLDISTDIENGYHDSEGRYNLS